MPPLTMPPRISTRPVVRGVALLPDSAGRPERVGNELMNPTGSIRTLRLPLDPWAETMPCHSPRHGGTASATPSTSTSMGMSVGSSSEKPCPRDWGEALTPPPSQAAVSENSSSASVPASGETVGGVRSVMDRVRALQAMASNARPTARCARLTGGGFLAPERRHWSNAARTPAPQLRRRSPRRLRPARPRAMGNDFALAPERP